MTDARGKTRWKLRSPFFKGAGTYPFGPDDGEKINLQVDDLGYFELDRPPVHNLGVFAQIMPSSP